MAHVWFAKDGPDGPSGSAFAELSIGDCCEKLGLTKAARMQLPEGSTPRFGDQTRKLSKFADPTNVVVEIRPFEAEQEGWEPGFYHLRDLTPAAAREIWRLREIQRIEEQSLAPLDLDRAIAEELDPVKARLEEIRRAKDSARER